MAKMDTLTDTWATIDAGKWDAWGGGNITIDTNRVKLVNTTATMNYWGFSSQDVYDLTGSYAGLEAVTLPSIDAADASMAVGILNLEIDVDNRFYWEIVTGPIIVCYKVVAGAYNYIGEHDYNAAVHKWFAISESGGTVTFWYATNPTGPPSVPNGWNASFTTTTEIDATELFWTASICNWNENATQQYTAILDNYNTFPTPTTINRGAMMLVL